MYSHYQRISKPYSNIQEVQSYSNTKTVLRIKKKDTEENGYELDHRAIIFSKYVLTGINAHRIFARTKRLLS